MKRNIIWVAVFIIGVGGWTYFDLKTHPASDQVQATTMKIVKKHPSLKPMHDKAMSDGVLSILEANAIFDEGKKLEK